MSDEKNTEGYEEGFVSESWPSSLTLARIDCSLIYLVKNKKAENVFSY